MRNLAALLAFSVAAAPGCRRGGAGRPKDGGPEAAAPAPAVRADAGIAARRLETAVIGDISIRRVDPGAHKTDLEDEDLAGAIGSVLHGSKAFASDEAEVPAGRTGVPARVAVNITWDLADTPKGRSIVCAVEAAIEWQRGERLTPRENVLTERPLAGDPKQAPAMVAQMVEQSVVDAARGLVAKEELRQGDDAAVLAELDALDPDAVLWALELVADRKLGAAFERALSLLKAKDAGVRAAALRALVALKDPRAVEPLARMANFSNPEELKLVVEAVSAIGGDDAAEFLEYVATGHSDADLRSRAREGLERIGRRRRPPEPK